MTLKKVRSTVCKGRVKDPPCPGRRRRGGSDPPVNASENPLVLLPHEFQRRKPDHKRLRKPAVELHLAGGAIA